MADAKKNLNCNNEHTLYPTSVYSQCDQKRAPLENLVKGEKSLAVITKCIQIHWNPKYTKKTKKNRERTLKCMYCEIVNSCNIFDKITNHIISAG